MAMRVQGTMTVQEFIDLALSKGAELGDLDGYFEISGLQGEFRARYLSLNHRWVKIPGKDDNDMLLDAEFVHNLKIRLDIL